MEKQQDLDREEKIRRMQAQLKVLPNEAGALCKEDLEEIFAQ
jgi:hypothetical protein